MSVTGEQMDEEATLQDQIEQGIRHLSQLLEKRRLLRERSLDAAAEIGPQIRKVSPAVVVEIRQKRLSKLAALLLKQRHLRKDFVFEDLLGEPAWDIMLELFIARVEGRKLMVTSLCIGSGASASTALRYIGELQDRGWIVSQRSELDNRRRLLEVSEEGFFKMGDYLRAIEKMTELDDRPHNSAFNW